MQTTINDIAKSLNDEVENRVIKGRLRKPVIRPYTCEYYFDVFTVHGNQELSSAIETFIRNNGAATDKPLHVYVDNIDEAIDFYRKFCAHVGVSPSSETEDYLKQQVNKRTEGLCLVIFERLIQIG